MVSDGRISDLVHGELFVYRMFCLFVSNTQVETSFVLNLSPVSMKSVISPSRRDSVDCKIRPCLLCLTRWILFSSPVPPFPSTFPRLDPLSTHPRPFAFRTHNPYPPPTPAPTHATHTLPTPPSTQSTTRSGTSL